MSDNIFFAALNALTNNGYAPELAHSAASIVANDDPSKPNLGRTPEDQQIIQETLPYLQNETWDSTGAYDSYQTIPLLSFWEKPIAEILSELLFSGFGYKF